MVAANKPIKFKYLFLGKDGKPISRLFCYKGQLDSQNILLDKETVPVSSIVETIQKFNRLIFTCHAGQDQIATVAIVITGGATAKSLKQNIDRTLSHTRLQQKQQAMHMEGRANEFRVETCKYCGAAIDLTGFPKTPQLYCQYCDSVVTYDVKAPNAEEQFLRFCDQCGLYSRPEVFTEFYFYFLVFVYGYRSTSKYMCHSCMRPKSWLMLGGNLLFLLGVPTAIYQIIRSHFGGLKMSLFSGLDEGNSKFKSGKYKQAAETYKAVEQKVRLCAGVKHNRGMAMERANSPQDAARAYQEALADCANYFPSAVKLAGLYERLGHKEQAGKIAKQFGLEIESDQTI